MSVGGSDPRAYLKVLWRWKLVFLAFLIGVPLIAYLLTSREQKVFQSSVLVQENALPVNTSLLTSEGASASSSTANAETLSGQARVIETPAAARLAAKHMMLPPSPSALVSVITATANTETGFITIAATAPSAQRAADIANAYGAAVVQLRTAQATSLLTSTISQVSAQLAQMRGGGSAVERDQLSSQLQRLRTLRAAQGANAQVLEPAVASAAPISPKVGSAVGLGVLAGLLLGLGAVYIAQAADRRIRHPEDLEELTGLPLLTVVPRGAFSEQVGDSRHDEAFHMLRSALQFFNIDRSLSTILVSSPLAGDGKTMVATRLAAAAAQAGREVILIDADLRRPQAATRLHVGGEAVQPGHGLAGVLTEQIPLNEALVDVPLGGQEENGDGSLTTQTRGRLRLLPAGGTPPNPSELLASQRMRDLLGEVAEMADLVILDTNPLLSVSDSLPLLDAVSGVVLVAKLNSTSRDAVVRLQKTIANTGGSVLGVVATGAAGGRFARYEYDYGYGYTAGDHANGNGRSGLLARLGRSRKVKQAS
jgi:capsular exopolysaccharide synthesis family protein